MNPAGKQRRRRELAMGLGFLAPNILGFMAFTLVPLVISLGAAFTNWDLKLHSRYKDTPVQWIGLGNFRELLFGGSQSAGTPDFWRYLGNTLFLMLGTPFGIAASLIAAILLSKDLRGGGGRTWLMMIFGAILLSCIAMLAAAGAGATAFMLLLVGLAGSILVGGTLGGSSIYRTLFYIPSFISGVATLLLWKKMYSQNGPLNAMLTGPLHTLGDAVNSAGSGPTRSVAWVLAGLGGLVGAWGIGRLRRAWHEGDMGRRTSWICGLLLCIPAAMCGIAELRGSGWFADHASEMNTAGQWITTLTAHSIGPTLLLIVPTILALIVMMIRTLGKPAFASHKTEGLGSGLMMAGGLVVVIFALAGVAMAVFGLPSASQAGLNPPGWLTDSNWAKPAMIVIGFWGAIGSNNMLLYLAALTNVPQDLYEAADLDGASGFQKFWHVTWPQLAPTTFFIVVMSGIGGLQAGFDQARVLTNGGPGDSTTSLAFMIYRDGLEAGRMGYSSATAWVLFVLVLLVTLINWRFGNRYVND